MSINEFLLLTDDVKNSVLKKCEFWAAFQKTKTKKESSKSSDFKMAATMQDQMVAVWNLCVKYQGCEDLNQLICFNLKQNCCKTFRQSKVSIKNSLFENREDYPEITNIYSLPRNNLRK